MRRKIPIALLLLAITIITWWLWPSPPPKNYPSSGETIIAFGDSLTFGEGVKPEETYPSILAERLGVPIVNAGVPGDTTALALKRLPALLAKYPKPKVVIVMLGGNDFLQRNPKEETYSNLSAAISLIQDRGAVVLLAGVRGGLFSDAFAEEFERLAEEHQTAYVPNILKGILGQPEFLADTIHPNAKGHKKMADRLEPILKKLID